HQYYDLHASGDKKMEDEKDNHLPVPTGKSVDSVTSTFEASITNAPVISSSPTTNQSEKKEEANTNKPMAYGYKKADDRAKQAERSSEPTRDMTLYKPQVRADSLRTADFYAKERANSENNGSFGA